MDIVKHSQRSVQCEVLTDSGQTVKCEVLTGRGQTVEHSSGQRDTEPRDGKVRRTDKQWRTLGDSSRHSDTEVTYGAV